MPSIYAGENRYVPGYGWTGGTPPYSMQPGGQQGQQTNLAGQLQQMYQMPSYPGMGAPSMEGGGMGFYGSGTGYGGQMDPWTLQNLFGPSFLQGQTLAGQLQRMQSGKSLADELAASLKLTPGTMGERAMAMGSLAEEPLRKSYEGTKREISDRFARSGTSLSSEYDRSMESAAGDYATGLRDIGIWASSEGQNQLMNALLKLYSTFQ